MIGMALFAVLMCVNFASCGNDDGEIPSDPTGDSPTNQPTNEKKLVQVMIYDDEEAFEEIIEFEYDENGNIVKVNERHNNKEYGWNVETFYYTWNSNKTITFKFNEGDEEFYEYILADGRITKMFYYFSAEKKHDEHTYFTYNKEGYITNFGGSSEGEIESFIWENSKLISVGSTDFIYTNQTCSGFFPLIYNYLEIIGKEDYIFMAQPELIGTKTNNLPKMIVDNGYTDGSSDTYTFEYELDQDKYITSCTIKEQSHSYNNKEYYYEFVWE